MDKKRIKRLIRESAELVSEVTGKPISTKNLEFILSDNNLENDTDVSRLNAAILDVRQGFDWKDYVEDNTPFKLATKAISKCAMKLSGHTTFAKVDDAKTIQFTPYLINESDKFVLHVLYHEMTHLQDFQLYSDRRYPLFQAWMNLEKKILAKKHELGLIDGYIRTHSAVRDLRELANEAESTLNNYVTLVESHASHVADECQKRSGIQMKDFVNLRILGLALLGLPLSAVPAFRKKAQQYERGRNLIKTAYDNKVDLSLVYAYIPTEQEFKNPQAYFARLG